MLSATSRLPFRYPEIQEMDMTAYIAGDISFKNEKLGPFSLMLIGMPLLSTVEMQGVRVKSGAVEKITDPSILSLLNYSLDEMVELDEETYEAKSSQYQY